ncbi:TlpA disulfide reductase family protein [Algibacter sp. TI.3.09]|uniref:TlpA family protein disulfide reductase n=1 Tax=Algibacter sp. TI.3.09 TaxID=3121298 RepID=UPI00311F8F37
MRKLFYFLLTLTFLISCNEKKSTDNTKSVKSEQITSSPTKIILNIKGYNPSEHKKYIDILIVTALEPIKEQLKISDDGNVNYVFLTQSKKEIIFDYDSRTFSLIVSPNEEIFVDLNITELLNWSKFKSFKVSGTNKITNNLILANANFIDSLTKQSTNAYVKDITLNNILYKNKRILEMENQLQVFKTYVSDKKIRDKIFIDWGKSQIKYKAGYDLSLYPFMGKSNRDLDDGNKYFDFVNEVRINSSNKITFKVYLDYLESLTGCYNIMGNVCNKYKLKSKDLEKLWPTTYFLKFDLLKKLLEGKDREIMMAYLFKNEIRLSQYTGKEIPKIYLDSLNLYTKSEYISQLLKKQETENKPIEALIKEYDLDEKEKKELLDLYKDTKGKVVYHDFWATWCAPCMNELPNYNDLIATTKGKNVEFIFYGVHMKSDEWEKTINNLGLKGKHYLLTKNQLAFFEKYFTVSSFPHHQIIKSDGTIGDKVHFRTYPNNFDVINKLIEKHKIDKNNGA